MARNPNRRSRGPFLLGFFTEDEQLGHMLWVEDLIAYWNNVYDLLDAYDYMVVQRLDATPFTKKHVQAIWRLMVENMSDDGFPLGRELFNKRRFLAIWTDKACKPFGRKAYLQYRSVLGKKALEPIFGKASISAFERRPRKEED